MWKETNLVIWLFLKYPFKEPKWNLDFTVYSTTAQAIIVYHLLA